MLLQTWPLLMHRACDLLLLWNRRCWRLRLRHILTSSRRWRSSPWLLLTCCSSSVLGGHGPCCRLRVDQIPWLQAQMGH